MWETALKEKQAGEASVTSPGRAGPEMKPVLPLSGAVSGKCMGCAVPPRVCLLSLVRKFSGGCRSHSEGSGGGWPFTQNGLVGRGGAVGGLLVVWRLSGGRGVPALMFVLNLLQFRRPSGAGEN